MRRRSGDSLFPLSFIIVALMVSALPAQADVAGERAAVAPVQTAVDASARLIVRAFAEASRDGTPDDARVILAQLENYSALLDHEWSLPEKATYREMTLAALPFIRELLSVVSPIPDDVALVATSKEYCAGGAIPKEDYDARNAAWFNLNATLRRAGSLAATAPPGVDLTPIVQAVGALGNWLAPTAGLRECYYRDPTTGMPVQAEAHAVIVTLRLSPLSTWPTGMVRASGVTNRDGPVRLDGPAVGLNTSIQPVNGLFEHVFRIPRGAPLGEAVIHATVEDRTASALLLIDLATPRLSVTGPSQVRPGSEVTYLVKLSSPMTPLTANATVLVSGAANGSIVLAGGQGTFRLDAPDVPQHMRFTFSYDGEPGLIRPASRTIDLEIAAATVAPPGAVDATRAPAAGPRIFERFPWSIPVILGSVAALVLLPAVLILLAIAAAWVVRGLRGRGWGIHAASGSGIDEARVPLPAAAPARGPSIAGQALTTLFSYVVRLMRRQGLVSPGMTARHIGGVLEKLGVESSRVVPAFEAFRYGAVNEGSSGRDDSRAWFERAWDRIRGGSP